LRAALPLQVLKRLFDLGWNANQPPSPSTAEDFEDGYVTPDQDTTRLAVFENTCVVEIAVQGAQDVGSSNNGRMDHRAVVRIRWNDAWRRPWEDDLRYGRCSDVAEVFGHLFISQLCCGSNAVVFENALKLFQKKWR
jgi:hypothetical protein